MLRPLALPSVKTHAVDAIRREAHPITGDARDYDALRALVGDARVVLLGEASHGTHEFYRERGRITRMLIAEHGFDAVAIEGDWPDAYRVNRYVRGEPGDDTAEQALRGFRRFPAWMWRNADVLDFVGWLRAHNDEAGGNSAKAGFYGLDLYGLAASIEAVVDYLETRSHAAAARARRRYECLQAFAGDSAAYGQAVLQGVSEDARRGAVKQLVELRRTAGEYLRSDDLLAADEQFCAEQNASLVVHAQEYYETMFGDRAGSWNLRDRHMADALDDLLAHLERRDGTARIVVWAHNSHIGDARATSMARSNECNLGQLMRERHGDDVVSVGFSTYTGTVTAADGWGAPARRKHLRRALPGSSEALLHETGLPAFLLCPLRGGDSGRVLRDQRLQRAIGVIYRSHTERDSHYLNARVARQFDALVHVDRTRAVQPLEPSSSWGRGEPPETYPTAL